MVPFGRQAASVSFVITFNEIQVRHGSKAHEDVSCGEWEFNDVVMIGVKTQKEVCLDLCFGIFGAKYMPLAPRGSVSRCVLSFEQPSQPNNNQLSERCRFIGIIYDESATIQCSWWFCMGFLTV